MKNSAIVAIAILIFIFGCLIGFCIKNYPLITWNKEVKIADVALIIITATVGIVIPLIASIWIEKSKNIKFMLIDECKEALSVVKKVSDKIEYCYQKKAIAPSDKDEIEMYFNNADLTIDNLHDTFVKCLKTQGSILGYDIKMQYISYWKDVTGGSLHDVNFTTIPDSFYKSETASWSKFEHQIKVTTYLIHLK